MDSIYRGKTVEQWKNAFAHEWMQSLTALREAEAFAILAKFCVWREYIAATLKSAGWSVEKFTSYHKSFGVSGEKLYVLVGEFISLEHCPPAITDINEIRNWIDQTYPQDKLIQTGKKYIEQNYSLFYY